MSFQYLCLDGTFGWRHVDGEDLIAAIRALIDFTGRLWKESLTDSNRHYHFVSVDEISGPASSELLHSIEELLSIRVSSRKRIYGYRENFTLHILWWDPMHQVYPVPKKYT